MVLLDLIDLRLQEFDELFVTLLLLLTNHLSLGLVVTLLLLLQIGDLLFVLLHLGVQLGDHFLTEVRSFCEFVLDLLVNLNVLLQANDLLSHLVILVEQSLSLFRLELQLARELVVLLNGQLRCVFQLGFIERK